MNTYTEKAINLLPRRYYGSLASCGDLFLNSLTEIRLRKDLPFTVSTYSENYYFGKTGPTKDSKGAFITTQEELLSTVSSLAEGSIYRFSSELKDGYIVTDDGIRAGVCGNSIYEGVALKGLVEYNSVNIRIPHIVPGASEKLIKFIEDTSLFSVLVISPPSVGKTTVIRDAAITLSKGTNKLPARAVSVIDERRELFPKGLSGHGAGMLDIFSGYRKADGIEIATRLFSPDLIICDEIGGKEDINAILASQKCGVPFICTAHGDSYASIKKRPSIYELFNARIFEALMILSKDAGFQHPKAEFLKL